MAKAELTEITQHLYFRSFAIDVQGIFLNADAAFDTSVVRSVLAGFGIEANIPMNPRNGIAQERDEYFDDKLYKQ